MMKLLRGAGWAAAAIALAATAPAQGRDKAAHILRRITFGPTPALVEQLAASQSAVDAYLNAQLNPQPENQVTTNLLALVPTPPTNLQELRQHQVIRATFSDNQLREVMTYFWERHLNTNYLSVNSTVNSTVFGGTEADTARIEWEEHDLLRNEALGTFYQLLRISAGYDTGAAFWVGGSSMRIYLNLWNSRCPNNSGTPNEDYARELLELHTVGPVDLENQPNYVHSDIEAVADIFSGWTVDYSDPMNAATFLKSYFDAANHCTNSPTFTGTAVQSISITSSGAAQGDDLLWQLSNLDATKLFVCRKLINFFLREDADRQFIDFTVSPPVPKPGQMLDNCIQAWGSSGGDITAVLSAIFADNSFQNSDDYRWSGIKMPIELVVGQVRATYIDDDLSFPRGGASGTPDSDAERLDGVDAMITSIDRLGQDLFTYPAPDGYSAAALDQPGSQKYIDVIDDVLGLYEDWTATGYPNGFDYDLVAVIATSMDTYVPGGQELDPDDVATFLLTMLYQSEFSMDDHFRVSLFVDEPPNGGPLRPLSTVIPGSNSHHKRILLTTGYTQAKPQGFKK